MAETYEETYAKLGGHMLKVCDSTSCMGYTLRYLCC